MSRGALLGLVLALGSSSGCAGRKLAVHGEPGGNLLALAAKQGERADKQHKDRPLVVLIEDDGLRAVDPVTATDRWRSSLRAQGHLAANDETVFVPLSEHRLAAIDRLTGVVQWKVELPGEALSGLAANGATVVATVVDHRKGRSRAIGLSALDGAVRWMRRTDARLGSPAVVGSVALVPIGNQVVALGARTGWERARLDLGGPAPQGEDIIPAVERVARRGEALYAGTDRQWVDLRTATSGRLDALEEVQGYGDVFEANEGLDAGHGDAERLHLWVDLSPTTVGHRDAIFVCRRAVVAMRVDAHGTPHSAQWTYMSDGPEFVGADVQGDRVVLVREDGLLVQVSRVDGSELDRIAGAGPTRGALMLDMPRRLGAPSPATPQRELRLAMMRDLILDPDPRLLPAQQLAVEILWHDEDASVRHAVERIAHGDVRTETTVASATLRAHAAERLAEPWGAATADQVEALREELRARPSYLSDVRPPAAVLARKAVAAGDEAMVGDLVALLNHPSTDASDLDPLVRALGDLGTAEALEGVATFLRRYHADEGVLYESAALTSAVDVLVAHAEQQALLQRVLDDPFTAPALRDYIGARVPEDGTPVTPDVPEHPPEIAALSTPSL
ncbi:MAG: PQQ-binding-like beta-propeller repeat protein [Nannocystaceae bacterium]|nr:PQQ-like beta-propeller repeat protein [bacterium]